MLSASSGRRDSPEFLERAKSGQALWRRSRFASSTRHDAEIVDESSRKPIHSRQISPQNACPLLRFNATLRQDAQIPVQ